MQQPPLAAPPHRVPSTVAFAGATVWNGYEALWFLVSALTASVLWMPYPMAVPYVFAVALVGAAWVRVRRTSRSVRTLRWGVIAEVVGVDTANDGSRNARIAHATGWSVQRRWYTGSVTISAVRYRVKDAAAHLFVRGLPFTSGVLVAHSKHPADAMAISDFPCDLRLDGRGRWSAWFPAGFWRQATATICLYAYTIAGLTLSILYR